MQITWGALDDNGWLLKKNVSPGWLGSFFLWRSVLYTTFGEGGWWESYSHFWEYWRRISMSWLGDGFAILECSSQTLEKWHQMLTWSYFFQMGGQKKTRQLIMVPALLGALFRGWFSQLDPQKHAKTWPPRGTTLAVLIDHGRGCHLH